MQQNQSQNPMAVEPVPKLMARIGLPIVLSMILQAAYNVVDSAYLARMASGGETALTALSLAFPVQLFMVAVSIGTGVGTNALLARLLGLGDKDRADTAVGNAQFLALVISALRGCASHSRGCSRHWSAVWSHSSSRCAARCCLYCRRSGH